MMIIVYLSILTFVECHVKTSKQYKIGRGSQVVMFANSWPAWSRPASFADPPYSGVDDDEAESPHVSAVWKLGFVAQFR
ncbi:hypothetical protein TNCV_3155251 [Trichonephila clavipes]|nr:hypothetical protein TNCV_3155251 [Trichonephila clavipes]